jgi:hypothetical protein
MTTPITVTPTVVDGVVSFDFVGSASWMEYPGGTSPYWEYDEGYNTKDLHDYSSTPQPVVRAIAGRITRPDHTVVRTHSLSAVSSTSTPNPGPSSARMQPSA